jgi:hypothetical protein
LKVNFQRLTLIGGVLGNDCFDFFPEGIGFVQVKFVGRDFSDEFGEIIEAVFSYFCYTFGVNGRVG